MTQSPAPYPAIALASSFFTYAGLLAVLLSSLADTWSGQASLLSAYLLLGAPVVMGLVAYTNRELRIDSVPHRWAFYAGALYFVVAPLMLLVALMCE
jgi:drug/metabolite transporter (DMT)-like permease